MVNWPIVFCTTGSFFSDHYHSMFGAILTYMSYETRSSVSYVHSWQFRFLNLLDWFPLNKFRSDPCSTVTTGITNKRIYTSNKLKKSRHELIYLHIEYVRYYKISNDCSHLPNTESLTKVCKVINNYDMTNTTQCYI
jgi:hypothetical protein